MEGRVLFACRGEYNNIYIDYLTFYFERRGDGIVNVP